MEKQTKGYNGNVLLKKENQAIDWTPDLVQEYIKCSEDPVYFTETYMKIINVDRGLVNFILYPYQKEMLKSMQENRFNIIATARQAGKSTVTCAFVLWYVIFHPEKTVALLANKGETAREILNRVQLAYQHLPRWLQQGIKEFRAGAMVLENNSRVLAAATSSDAIRGYSINLLFIDEAAFIDNWDAFFTSVYPTISSGKESKIVLVSTPNGLNHFYAIWQNAHKTGIEHNGYNPIRVMWQDVPGRDEAWRNSTLAAMNFDMEKFEQEYCVEFLGSSGTLIGGWKLKELVHQTPEKYKDGLAQYAIPVPGRIYACIVDVSRGKGLDYSAFHVIDVTEMPYKQVCVYRNNLMTPIEFAEVIHRVCKLYNNSVVMVEINDLGEQVGHMLHYDFEYENVLFTENSGRAGKKVSQGFGTGGRPDMGIRTTTTVKATGCAILKLLIEQNQLIINDFHTIEELATFSRKGKSYEAEEGKHDDLVMGLVLFAWLSDQQYFKDYTNINTMIKLRERSEEEIMSDLSPFGFVDDGRGDLEEALQLSQGHDHWFLGVENENL
jgi:hypothetical protein